MKEYQETRDFLVRSIVRDILFKKQEMKYIEREIKQLMNILDYQLDTMSGIELVTVSALIAEIGDVMRLFTLVLVGKVRHIKVNKETGCYTLYFII